MIGDIVEFLEGGRFVVAICLGTKGQRFHLLTHLGKELNLSKNRIIHSAPSSASSLSRHEICSFLQEKDGLRQKILQDIDIKEVWELIDGEENTWTAKGFSGLIFGNSSTIDHEAACIRAVITEKTHFKFKDGLIRAQSREAVERLILQRKREEEKIRRIEAGMSLLKSIWSDEEGSREPAIEDKYGWLDAIRDYCINGDEAEASQEVKELFKKVGLYEPSAPFRTLVRANIWDEDENIELLRAGIERGFSKEVEDEAIFIRDNYEAILNKRPSQMVKADKLPEKAWTSDVNDLFIFTIDGEDSKDLDDAISVRELDNGLVEIGVHITDVASFITPSSLLFDLAIERATSLYLPDETISMLPETLSQDAFSLHPGKKRASVSFRALLDKDGMLKDSSIEMTTISSSRRYSYEQADDIIKSNIKNGDKDAAFGAHPPLNALYELACKLRDRRIKEGNALPLPIPELSIRVDEAGNIRIWLDEQGQSRFLISEMMILANSIAARFLRDNNIPALYRSQPEPRERIIEGMTTDLRLNYRQRRLISRGILGPEPEYHSGLGLDCYTTVTSPMRRGLDLIMQSQIVSLLTKGVPCFSRQELEGLSLNLQTGLINAAGVRQARFRYWLLKHFKDRCGEDLKAWVLDVFDNKVLMVIEDYLITAELPKEHKMEYFLDQELFVRVKKVNPRENQLKFEWGRL